MKRKKPYKVVHADVSDWVDTYEGPKFHALLSDAPYLINFMGKKWDAEDNIVGDVKFWKKIKRHLLPGAFCFVFSSTRTLHRVMTAVEDAGFVIHPVMIAWNYSNGMPKATNPSYQIDKINNAQRIVTKEYERNGTVGGILGKKVKILRRKSKSGLDDGRTWETHRYGLQALKPAFEPIIVFQKPYPKSVKPVVSMLETGAGALNIEATRIGYKTVAGGNPADNPHLRKAINGGNGGHVFAHEANRRVVIPNENGRWPSNLILVHHPECKCVGEHKINEGKSCNTNRNYEATNKSRKRDLKFGMTPGKRRGGEETVPTWKCVEVCPVQAMMKQSKREAGIDRYYFQADWSYDIEERLYASVPVKYAAKPSKREKDAGLSNEVMVTDPYARHRGRRMSEASRIDGKPPSMGRNPHETVKPLALAEYLTKLLLPPKRYKRRLLVPFGGSGSEAVGGVLAGWDKVVTIEREADYIPIAKARLKYWQHRKLDPKNPEGVLKQKSRRLVDSDEL